MQGTRLCLQRSVIKIFGRLTAMQTSWIRRCLHTSFLQLNRVASAGRHDGVDLKDSFLSPEKNIHGAFTLALLDLLRNKRDLTRFVN
jgi:hypothetical protein